MLTAHHLSKSYNQNIVLTDVSFTINPSDRVGLIGPNGCGKTTLLRILVGQETPDEGLVTFSPADLRLGYLSQGFQPDSHLNFRGILDITIGDPKEAEETISRLAKALSVTPDRSDLQSAFDAALLDLQRINQIDRGNQTAILKALGLDDIPDNMVVSKLSGGQKTRLALALVLLKHPQMLMLDEPTNHLDIHMLEWLESWLASFPGAALIVTHDRTFLDNSVSRILDLNPDTHTIQVYQGNYSDYLEQYQLERQKQQEAYQDQIYQILKMRQDIARTKHQALKVELTTTSRQPGVRRYAKKVAKKAKSREKKLERYLDSDKRLEKPKQSWQMKIDFRKPEHVSQEVLLAENLAIAYPDNPPILSGLNLHIRSGERIAFTGPNGSGKTSLVRTIAGHLKPASGRIRLAKSAQVGYMAQEQEVLNPELSALQTIQRSAPMNETESRSFLHFFLFGGDDPLRPIKELSYGERARLILATLVSSGSNFLLLDEPINHLDIPSRQRFEQALKEFDGTILMVVHDRYFIQRFATKLWILDHNQLREEIITL